MSVEIKCEQCGASGKFDMNVAWKYRDMRLLGAVTIASVQCLKCKAIMMMPVPHKQLMSKEEKF